MEIVKIIKNKIRINEFEPLFFFNKKEKGLPGYNHTDNWEIAHYHFVKDLITITNNPKFISPSKTTILTFGKRYEPSTVSTDFLKKPEDEIWFILEPFNPQNLKHLSSLTSIVLKKNISSTQSHYYKELLWVLNNYILTKDILIALLDTQREEEKSKTLFKIIASIAPCLSPRKQKLIKEIFGCKSIPFTIYFPEILRDALTLLFPTINIDESGINIFGLTRLALVGTEYKIKKQDTIVSISTTSTTINSQNYIIKLRNWLKDVTSCLDEFQTLAHFFRVIPPDIQLKIIRRYFESIRLNQTRLDIDLLKLLKINKFDNWATYYHYAHNPGKSLDLTIPFLCDSIITFIESNRKEIIKFNSVIDLALLRSDYSNPQINVGLTTLLPICRHNAVINPKFEGFVTLQTLYEFNFEDLNFSENIDASLVDLFSRALSLLGSRKSEIKCNHPKFNIGNCPKIKTNVDSEIVCRNCDAHSIKVLDEWVVINQNDSFKILSLFIDKNLSSEVETISKSDLSVKYDQFKERFQNYFSEIKESKTNTLSKEKIFVFNLRPSSHFLSLFSRFLSPVGGIIELKKNAYVGCGVLDISHLSHLNPNEGLNVDFNSIERQKLENIAIAPLIRKTIKELFNLEPDAQNQYIISYNSELFNDIIRLFHVKPEVNNSIEFGRDNQPFLISTPFTFDKFCAPLATERNAFFINDLLRLPYYWCRGKNCYKNCLHNQTISTTKSWHYYSLLHFFEIIGTPMVSKQNGIFVVEKLIRDTIGQTNKIETFFKKMTCEECGHILFPVGKHRFGLYNNFECRNPSCDSRFKRVYLNYCFGCGMGLIDSRFSQKCPNGMYICPSCQSCCNSKVYYRMANRYISSNLPVPRWISSKQENAHNDKDRYFCHKCATPLSILHGEHNKLTGYCAHCNVSYSLKNSYT